MIVRSGVPAVLLAALPFVAPLAASPAAAGDARSSPTLRGKDLVQALREGGYVVYFRHAATNPEQADTDRLNLGRCETQRNLSPEGRQQAQALGRAFTRLGIRVGKVLASPFCRTRETAQLAFGAAEKSNALHFAVGADKAERVRQTEQLRRMLATFPKKGTNTVIVSHHANLKEATGIWPKREGDAHVFRPRPGGDFDHVAEVTVEEWVGWARETSGVVDRVADPGRRAPPAR